MHISAKCQVCGDQLEESAALKLCPSCETPHHTECWSYAGGCSTYGCSMRGKAWRSIPLKKQHPVEHIDELTPDPIPEHIPERLHSGLEYRRAQRIQVKPAPGWGELTFLAGHGVLGGVACFSILAVASMGGSRHHEAVGPHAGLAVGALLFGMFGWMTWAALHFIYSQIVGGEQKPVEYFRKIYTEGKLSQICPISTIHAVRVVEGPSYGRPSFGVALSLFNGDQILVVDFGLTLGSAQHEARRLVDALHDGAHDYVQADLRKRRPEEATDLRTPAMVLGAVVLLALCVQNWRHNQLPYLVQQLEGSGRMTAVNKLANRRHQLAPFAGKILEVLGRTDDRRLAIHVAFLLHDNEASVQVVRQALQNWNEQTHGALLVLGHWPQRANDMIPRLLRAAEFYDLRRDEKLIQEVLNHYVAKGCDTRVLVAALGPGEVWRRAAAATALGYTKGAKADAALPGLVRLMDAKSSFLCNAASEALAKLPCAPEAIAQNIIQLLQTMETWRRPFLVKNIAAHPFKPEVKDAIRQYLKTYPAGDAQL